MDAPDTTLTTAVTETTGLRAVYTAEIASAALREQLAAIGVDGPRRRTTLSAARSALRVDLEASDGSPMLSVVRRGADPLWALDHPMRAYRALARAAVDEPAEANETTGPATRFGPTLIVERRLREARLRVQLLAQERDPTLRGWWPTGFAGLLPRRYHDRVPVAIELWLGPDDQPAARLVLQSLERATMPITAFQPPSDYRLVQVEPGTHRAPAPAAPNPPPRAGLARESAIAALLGAFDDEVVKLQLRDEVPERLRRSAWSTRPTPASSSSMRSTTHRHRAAASAPASRPRCGSTGSSSTAA